MSKSLSTSQSRIRGTNRACDSEHGSIAFQHHEGRILLGKPPKRRQRNEAIRSNYDEASQAVPNFGKASFATVRTDTILNRQVTAFDVYPYPKTEEG